MARPNRKLPELTPQDIAKFQSRVNKQKPDECWNWLGSPRSKKGYGCFAVKMVNFAVHRIAYFIHYGVDPGEMLVCHTCDNPPCCNPKHLFLGTSRDNVADMMAKGRRGKVPLEFHNMHIHPETVQGSKHGRSKLTEANVINIRASLKSGETVSSLARSWGVCSQTISNIKNRRLWRHI